MSMDSLSQLYNQSLRLKFGSAPAQLLLGKGEHAERSLEKRVSAIKNQFNTDNLVNTKSQVTKQLASKHMGPGQLSNRNNANSSWLKIRDDDGGLPTYKSSNLPDSQMKASKKSLDLSLARATVNTNLTNDNMEYRQHKKDMTYDEEDFMYEHEHRGEELEGEEDLLDDDDDEDDDVVISPTSKNQANVMRHHGKKSSTKYPSKRPNPSSSSSSSSSSANSSSMKILGKIYS